MVAFIFKTSLRMLW